MFQCHSAPIEDHLNQKPQCLFLRQDPNLEDSNHHLVAVLQFHVLLRD